MTPTQPPRIAHNANEHDKFLRARGIRGLFPKVTAQVPSVLINRRALPAYAYNGSIVRHDGRLLLAYRYHEGTLSTRLGVAELDEQFNVKACHKLGLPGKSVEDPRFFIHGKHAWISYVESTWPEMPPKCVVRYTPINPDFSWSLAEGARPHVGRNDFTAMEKNFVFFESGENLYFIYDTFPEQIVYDTDWDSYRAPGARWRFGRIRGGCVTPYKGKLLRFFHSAVDGEPPPYTRRYFMGALLMEPTPPFKILSVMDTPLIYGSEDDDLTPTERSSIVHYKGKVCFPMGVITDGDGWLVSAGINDSHIALLKITPEMLKL